MARGKSWEVFKAECETVAAPGITIKGFVEPWNGNRTKLICNCDLHGDWLSCSIDNFKRGKGCPVCHREKLNKVAKKDDDHHIKNFMSTGSFLKGTVFNRSPNKPDFWVYTCPICSNDEYVKAGICSGVFTANRRDLKRGSISCRCSEGYDFTPEQWQYRLKKQCAKRGYQWLGWKGKISARSKFNYICHQHGEQTSTPDAFLRGQGCAQCGNQSQKQAYINLIGDRFEFTSFKFGIAIDSSIRLKTQKNKAQVKLTNFGVWEFPTVEACKSAERKIKQTLPCGVVGKDLLPNGYTETLSIEFIDQVQAIYLEFGGVLQKPSLKRPKRLKARKSKSVLLTT